MKKTTKRKLTKKQKEKKFENEGDELFSHITSENIDTLMQKVGWILNHNASARDSDITCQIKYWERFEPDAIRDGAIKLKDLYRHTHLTSIARARAKIQNDYHLFLASEEVRKHRGTLEEDYESWAINSQPDCPLFSVYIDESGKTGNFIILGSIWIIDQPDSATLFRGIMDLKSRLNYDQEIHFANISEAKSNVYIQLIDLLYEHSNSFCFKYCIVEKEGNSNIQDTLNKMLYHLLLDGVRHENETGRAPLPRALLVVKDIESKGADKLLLKEVKDRMQLASNTFFNQQLFLNEFKAIDSKEHFYLQIADVFAASINRILNEDGARQNAKDRVAKYMLEKFDFEIDEDSISSLSDFASEMQI